MIFSTIYNKRKNSALMPINYANQKFNKMGLKYFVQLIGANFFFERDKNYINYRGFKNVGVKCAMCFSIIALN